MSSCPGILAKAVQESLSLFTPSYFDEGSVEEGTSQGLDKACHVH